MTNYDVPQQFDIQAYPFELRNKVGHFLNTHIGKHTIPEIAKALQADEKQVAWVLTNLCELTTPEVMVDSIKGHEYWEHCFKLKGKAPKSFNEGTVFHGRTSQT
jgi:hypothetical protein